LRPLIQSLNRSQRSRAWNDSKVTAHHGIIPTLEPTQLTRMSDKERAVYRLIRAHYLAQFLPAHEYDRTMAQLSCVNLVLQARGKQIVTEGWHSVLDSTRENADGEAETQDTQTLPPLQSGARCTLTGIDLKSLNTLPPKPFTQGELIKAMKGVARLVSDPRLKQKLKDTTGIGTEATRAGIIQGLIGRGYLFKQGRAIRASDAALILINAVPSAITDPGTTAVWEQALDLIAAGQMTLDDFVAKQSAWVSQLVSTHAHTSLSIGQANTPTCPLCNASMRKRSSKHGQFWSCARYPECKATRPVEGAEVRRESARRRSPRNATPNSRRS
jgi:DNA topoisomerase-3